MWRCDLIPTPSTPQTASQSLGCDLKLRDSDLKLRDMNCAICAWVIISVLPWTDQLTSGQTWTLPRLCPLSHFNRPFTTNTSGLYLPPLFLWMSAIYRWGFWRNSTFYVDEVTCRRFGGILVDLATCNHQIRNYRRSFTHLSTLYIFNNIYIYIYIT